MKKRICALLLAVAVLLSGCSTLGYYDALGSLSGVAFADMTYTRPDMEAFQQAYDTVITAANSGESVEDVAEKIYTLYDAYDSFYTNYCLADIHYCIDMTDIYWTDEYNFCVENCTTVDATMDQLYYDLAASSSREALEGEDYFGADFFDDYEGESVYDETFTALLEQEADLINRFYALSSDASAVEYGSDAFYTQYGAEMGKLYVEMVALRQKIAAYCGYASYPEFAYDFYHYRDYTPQQSQDYLEAIRENLYTIYCHVNRSKVRDLADVACSEGETFRYVQELANALGGQVRDAFRSMDKKNLYHISYGENKYQASFETYLYSYYQPFVFMCPTGSVYDKLTFSHEFGHFVNDYVCYGSYAGTDVVEVHSQGMEYLSLCYCEGTEDLEKLKMADSLCVYMEQAAYAAFEHQVYALEGDELTLENVYALYNRIGLEYGFDSWGWDSRDFVTVTHFFTNPMYIMSYVVSNDLAMQIYQLERAEKGAGLAVYRECIGSEDTYILTFAETYGLESPFAEGRLESVAQTFTEILGT